MIILFSNRHTERSQLHDNREKTQESFPESFQPTRPQPGGFAVLLAVASEFSV